MKIICSTCRSVNDVHVEARHPRPAAIGGYPHRENAGQTRWRGTACIVLLAHRQETISPNTTRLSDARERAENGSHAAGNGAGATTEFQGTPASALRPPALAEFRISLHQFPDRHCGLRASRHVRLNGT